MNHDQTVILMTMTLGLEEARGILEFRNEAAKIESWIRDKELMISQGDLGKDYEHCLELQKKLDDVDGDMKVFALIILLTDVLCLFPLLNL